MSTSKIFDPQSAKFLLSAFSSSVLPPLQGLPEVVVTGRANVGKSTLLNRVLGRKDIVHVSKKAGHTRSLNFYRVGPGEGKLVLVDAPGYGARGRPEWGELFDSYLQNRECLRRVYILFNAQHILNEADKEMLRYLDEKCQATSGTRWTLQAVITKTDALPTSALRATLAKMQQDIFQASPVCLPAIITAAGHNIRQPHFGIGGLRSSIMEACLGS